MVKSKHHERRQLKRTPFFSKVEIIGVGVFGCLNLSTGGLYLQNKRPFQVGSVVDLRFKLRDKDEHPLTVQACVTFRHEGTGFGLAFIDLSLEDHEKIVRFIEQR